MSSNLIARSNLELHICRIAGDRRGGPFAFWGCGFLVGLRSLRGLSGAKVFGLQTMAGKLVVEGLARQAQRTSRLRRLPPLPAQRFA